MANNSGVAFSLLFSTIDTKIISKCTSRSDISLMTNRHTHFFSAILSFVISVIASIGFKDRVWFGLCHFLVTAHVIFVQSSSSTWGQYFTSRI